MLPGLSAQDSDFSHLSLSRHIQHDLCSEAKGVAKRLAIGQHRDFPLGGHVILKERLLLFAEPVSQGVTDLYKFIQRLGVLAAALKTALVGANIAEVQAFQN